MNINSRNILLTETCRAKIAGLGAKSLIDCSKDTGAPSVKVDVYGFGVMLFELISGEEAVKGAHFKKSLGFLGEGEGEGDGFVFERLKGLVDPCLEEDYPIGEALCLAVLARACVEDDPLHRPSMSYVLKILARMV
ncbi:Chitin elicitor receptor kinase 1 [Acorus calamus]|uniref:Chitin elicitor receptor kinase 1 n=1 Tax=Acorus calamus TaxID=4465 RepID=A0AAV9EMQ4_ACOCL|nr:Chitin elicitor receptor kinase 1 [Acorus calamus]